MKKIILMAAAAVLLLAGCDKINEDEYTVYDGAVVTWSAGSADLTAVQRVFVEKFTGPKCNNCPNADATLSDLHQQYGDRLVLVSINHPTGQGEPFPGDPDLRTDGGNVWDSYYGIDAIPSAFINRDKSHKYDGSMNNIRDAVANHLQQSPVVAIEATAVAAEQVSVAVDLQFMQSYTDNTTLTVAVVEDSLVYRQIMPDHTIQNDYAHNHMLRKVVTGFWGRDIECSGAAGEKVHGTLAFTLPEECVADNCHVVVFVSDKNTRRVLNSTSCTIQ